MFKNLQKPFYLELLKYPAGPATFVKMLQKLFYFELFKYPAGPASFFKNLQKHLFSGKKRVVEVYFDCYQLRTDTFSQTYTMFTVSILVTSVKLTDKLGSKAPTRWGPVGNPFS